MRISVSSIVIVIIAVIILVVVLSFFLSGTDQPIEERRIFAQGCTTYCGDIRREAAVNNEPLESAAVRKADELRGGKFMQACHKLYPDTTPHPYLCWNRDCCYFELRPP